MKSLLSFLPVAALALGTLVPAHALVLYSGSAAMILDEGKADSIGFFDSYFGDEATRAETLSTPSPGTEPFTGLSGSPGTLGTSTTSGTFGTPGQVQVIDAIRPFGETVPTGTPGGGRSRQVTNLDFDSTDILGSWGASTDSFGTFVNLGSGEQIAFKSMQRWGGPFTGALLYGDFALRYVPTKAGTSSTGGILSGLVLTSNIDFLNASWADIANASISFNETTGMLSISGDLLISGAINVLDPSAAVGTKFGTFSLTASTVPEPSAFALLAGAFAGACVVMRRRVRRS